MNQLQNERRTIFFMLSAMRYGPNDKKERSEIKVYTACAQLQKRKPEA